MFNAFDPKKEDRPFEKCFDGIDTIDCMEPVPVLTDTNLIKHETYKKDDHTGEFIVPVTNKYNEFKKLQFKANLKKWGPPKPPVSLSKVDLKSDKPISKIQSVRQWSEKASEVEVPLTKKE